MIFPPANLCIAMPPLPTIEDICLPGGICLSYVWGAINQIPSQADISLDFFGQIGPALTPLVPIFNIIDTVLAIFKCVSAIPDAITSLNPKELLECVPALAQLIDQLLKLIPQLSIPKMIKAALSNLASLLMSVASELQRVQILIARIAAMINRAAELNDVRMNGFLVCAQSTIEASVLSTAEALKGIGRIVLLINIFIAMLGGQEIPCFGTLFDTHLEDGLDVIIELLLGVAEVITMIADAIPDPDLALTLLLGDTSC